MKKLYIYLTAVIVMSTLMFTSCQKDFLEKPLSSDVTIDTIFSTRLKAESFLWDTYKEILPVGFALRNWNDYDEMTSSMSAQMCDEGGTSISWSSAYAIAINGMNADGPREDNFQKNFKGIRKAYIFLENIDKVTEIPATEKVELKAEAKVLIALRYSEMLRRYGGVPILTKSLSVSDDLKIPRASVEETVNFIVGLCDEASAVLPDTYESKWRGRVHKGVGLAVKGRTLLMAARPLFNTNTPYMSGVDPKLISYGNYNADRWKLAAEANEAVISWAAQSGWCKIINTGNPFNDFTKATSTKDNEEVLLAFKNRYDSNEWGFWEWYVPFEWQGGIRLTYNILTKFRDASGNDVTWPTPDPTNSNLDVKPFSEYTNKMNNMEPRWKASAWVVAQRAYNNPQAYDWAFDTDGQSEFGVARSTKFIASMVRDATPRDWIIFRLSEFYLNAAEAWNEHQANDQKAYTFLNVIRKRGGLPEVATSNSEYNTQEKLRGLLIRERAVELLCEEHRLFDVRQWKIASQNGVLGGDFYGFRYTQNSQRNGYNDYHTFKYEKRFWSDNQYLYPFPKVEINKGYIIQNPGY